MLLIYKFSKRLVFSTKENDDIIKASECGILRNNPGCKPDNTTQPGALAPGNK